VNKEDINVAKRIIQDDVKGEFYLIEQAGIEDIRKIHESIKDLKLATMNRKEKLEEIICSSIWVMLEEQEETNIHEDLVIIDENIIIEKSTSKTLSLEMLERKEGIEKSLKKECADEYSEIIDSMINQISDFGPKMVKFFNPTEVSLTSIRTHNNKSLRYIIDSDTFQAIQVSSIDDSFNIDIYHDNSEDRLLNYKRDILKLQNDVSTDLREINNDLVDIEELLIDAFEDSLVSMKL
jgi:hypothetical protein